MIYKIIAGFIGVLSVIATSKFFDVEQAVTTLPYLSGLAVGLFVGASK
jgi:hypothetical protein